MNKIHFPIAISKETNRLVTPEDVANGKNCNCLCFNCNENLIAINNPSNKQKPHFRHDTNSKCSANFETYMHWLSKEVFKEITEITIPELNHGYVNNLIEQKLNNIFNKFKTPIQIRRIIQNNTIKNISKERTIKIQKVSLEETFKSRYGDIRVDIVLRFINKKGEERILFIEPFLSNKINTHKLEKLRNLEISTLSLNLCHFVERCSHSFTIELFKDFIVNNTFSKEWVLISLKNIIPKNFEEIVKRKIENNSHLMTEYNKIMNDIKSLNNEITKLEDEIGKLNFKVQKLYRDKNRMFDKLENLEFK